MTKTTLISLVAAAFVLAAEPGSAQSTTDEIVDRLSRQGFERIRVSRTFLGRVRIVAEGAAGTREIVLNPSNGSILRDYSEGGGRDRDDDDDREDDDRDDDDRDDDDRDDDGDDGGDDGGGDDDDD